MKRQAATPKGLEKRLRDLQFELVGDPRYQPNVNHPLPMLLCGLIAAMISGASAFRHVERRTGQIAKKLGGWMGLVKRIPDNVFSTLLARLLVTDLLGRLHSLVNAEQRRGNLKPTVLPLGTVAIDGKNVATLRWHDLCRVLELEQATTSVEKVRQELKSVYGHSGLIGMVTTDAGNTSLAVAQKIVDDCKWAYFCQIKSEHGEIYREANRALQHKQAPEADASGGEKRDGKDVTYRVWCHDLEGVGWLGWTSARQLVRVERTVVDRETGEVESVGNRYYVTSKTPTELGPQSCLTISRGHWRCENETHWTVDVKLAEDRRRLSMSRHPNGVFVVAALRAVALNILAVARKLSRTGTSEETPSWMDVVEHFLLVLCESALASSLTPAACHWPRAAADRPAPAGDEGPRW